MEQDLMNREAILMTVYHLDIQPEILAGQPMLMNNNFKQ
jgi:hypothetical protein